MDVFSSGAAGLSHAASHMARAAQAITSGDSVKQTLGLVALKAAQQQQAAMLKVVQASVEATRDLMRATDRRVDFKA
jgi:hypothetical protein